MHLLRCLAQPQGGDGEVSYFLDLRKHRFMRWNPQMHDVCSEILLSQKWQSHNHLLFTFCTPEVEHLLSMDTTERSGQTPSHSISPQVPIRETFPAFILPHGKGMRRGRGDPVPKKQWILYLASFPSPLEGLPQSLWRTRTWRWCFKP